MENVFTNLVPSYKWLQHHRSVKVGDVCLIRYKNEVRSNYRLGCGKDVKRGNDGLVRTVILKYKLAAETKFRTVDHPVQGISIIVPVEKQTRLDPSVPEYIPKQEH